VNFESGTLAWRDEAIDNCRFHARSGAHLRARLVRADCHCGCGANARGYGSNRIAAEIRWQFMCCTQQDISERIDDMVHGKA
jgi:hypothetical protein